MRYVLSLLLLLALAVSGHCQSTVSGRVSPDGTEEVRVDLPDVMHIRNTGGTDGAGLCVWASGSMMGEWQGEQAVSGLFLRMQKKPGGGWPERVDEEMMATCPGVKYVQHTGGDQAVLRAILSTGRIACITYGYSPRYRGGIDHMVCLVHFSEKWAAVLDNNFPGTLEWMQPGELVKRWLARSGGWAWTILSPPPPGIPVNPRPAVIGQRHQVWVEVSPGSRWYDVWEGSAYMGRCYLPPGDNRLSVEPECKPEPADGTASPPTGVTHGPHGAYGDSHNGRKLPPGELLSLLRSGDTVPDDSHRMSVSIIGAEGRTADVLRQLRAHPGCLAFLGNCKVRTFTPADPLCHDAGLDANREFSIVIQGPEQPNGRAVVLHRQNDFDGGAEAVWGAIRRVDPTYDPTKDVDQRKAPTPQPQPQPDPAASPWYLSPWVIGAVLFVLALIVPSPLRPFVAALQAMNAARQPAAVPAVDLDTFMVRIKALEEKLLAMVPKKE